jgi:hypothetical protein
LDDLFPLTLMAIQATGLAPDASVVNHTINRFFTTTTTTTTPPFEKPTTKTPPSFTLDHFFKHQAAPSADRPPDSWTCDQCHLAIPLEKVDEHTDYHFAQELAKEGTSRSRNDPQPGKKKRRLFFEPSSSSSS